FQGARHPIQQGPGVLGSHREGPGSKQSAATVSDPRRRIDAKRPPESSSGGLLLAPLENKGKTPHQPSLAPSRIHDTCQTDLDLAQIYAAWSGLPPAVRASIMMLVRAASGGG